CQSPFQPARSSVWACSRLFVSTMSFTSHVSTSRCFISCSSNSNHVWRLSTGSYSSRRRFQAIAGWRGPVDPTPAGSGLRTRGQVRGDAVALLVVHLQPLLDQDHPLLGVARLRHLMDLIGPEHPTSRHVGVDEERDAV